MSEPFIAEIKMFGSNFAPRSYALCNGQLMAISQNTALFSLVGTIYGGDGRTTFGLPDLRSRSPLQQGTGPGLSTYRLGEKGGAPTHRLTTGQMPAHSHPLGASSANATTGTPAATRSLGVTAKNVYGPPNSLVSMGGSTTPQGSSGAHNNRQPYLAVNFIIALIGIFPSRA